MLVGNVHEKTNASVQQKVNLLKKQIFIRGREEVDVLGRTMMKCGVLRGL